MPRKIGSLGHIIFLFFVIITCFICFQSKIKQLEFWQLSKEKYYFENKPMLSGNDSSYFLKLAKDYKNNEKLVDNYSKSNYPDNSKSFSNTDLQEPSHFKNPLLKYIIVWFSNYYFNGDIFTGANYLIPFFTVLTALSIIVLFAVMGFKYEGVISAIGGVLSQSIFVRTSIGRVDTDLLNVGFMYIILSFITLHIFNINLFYSSLLIVFAGLLIFLFSSREIDLSIL